MDYRIYIWLNTELFTNDGTEELVDYFRSAEAIQHEFETWENVKAQSIHYYFYTKDYED